MKKMQDANKIVKQATQEKSAIKNLNFLIDLAMVSSNTKLSLDGPQMSNKDWKYPNKKNEENAKKPSTRRPLI